MIYIKCPSCGKESCKYVDDRNEKYYKKRKKLKRSQQHKVSQGVTKHEKINRRDKFMAKCTKCGWEGHI